MFQQKPKPGAGDWEGRLSGELQNLPRMHAPWYFEAELQRRMRFANQKRSALPGRAQSIALAVLAVSLLGTAAFFLLIFSQYLVTVLKWIGFRKR